MGWMKKHGKAIVCVIVGLFLLFFFVLFEKSMATKEIAIDSIYTYASSDAKQIKIDTIQISGTNVMVLPMTVSENFALHVEGDVPRVVRGGRGFSFFKNGKVLRLSVLCRAEDYTLRFYNSFLQRKPVYELKVYFFDHIPTIYLCSDDPINKGRAWVEEDPTKSNKAKGHMLMQNALGETVYEGALTQVKGRGNTTWGFDKKPYQIKTETKVDLLETGNAENKSKTWILLANYLDATGLRNQLALNLGQALGMPSHVDGKSVVLYYDGAYRGMYMLTEKVEVGSGRVDILDLEEENLSNNPDVTLEALPMATATTANGATYRYCKGLKSPTDITGGYLLEMDYEVRALEELCYFKTKRGQYVVVKSPEYATKEEMSYIAALYQAYEDSVYAGGTNPQTGKRYSDYIDAHSLACYYVIHELSKSRDTMQSSAYLHKNAGEDKLVFGPLWDFDMSFGKGAPDEWVGDDSPFGLATLQNQMCRALMSIPDFYELVKSVYFEEMEPKLYNLMRNTSEMQGENDALYEFARACENVSDAAKHNAMLWHADTQWEVELNRLHDFIRARTDALSYYFHTYDDIYQLPAHSFYDVLKTHPYYDSITLASKKGMLQSFGYGLFGPEKPVERLQLAQCMYSMSGPSDASYEPILSDVSADAWYAVAAVWSVENHLMDAAEDGAFHPNAVVTREDIAETLYRVAGMPQVDTASLHNLKDADRITKKEAMAWAVDNGLLRIEQDEAKPKEIVTLAEFADILIKFYP